MKVYIGIDWSTQKHDIVYLNEEGGLILYQTIPHSPAGFEVFDEQRQDLGVGVEDCLVGIETEHNLIMDFLRSRGYGPIYVIPPSMIRDSRGRFRASKAKTDRSDAYLIADMLRTDQARLHVWQADSSLTQQIIALVSLERFLTRAIVKTSQRQTGCERRSGAITRMRRMCSVIWICQSVWNSSAASLLPKPRQN